MLNLVDSPGISIGNREVIVSALEKYIKGKADFADYLIAAEGEKYDAPKLASFDKHFCAEDDRCESPNKFY